MKKVFWILFIVALIALLWWALFGKEVQTEPVPDQQAPQSDNAPAYTDTRNKGVRTSQVLIDPAKFEADNRAANEKGMAEKLLWAQLNPFSIDRYHSNSTELQWAVGYPKDFIKATGKVFGF